MWSLDTLVAVNACIRDFGGEGSTMAVITIRGVDDAVKQALRERAARHGLSGGVDR
jgi:hypothetical protein